MNETEHSKIDLLSTLPRELVFDILNSIQGHRFQSLCLNRQKQKGYEDITTEKALLALDKFFPEVEENPLVEKRRKRYMDNREQVGKFFDEFFPEKYSKGKQKRNNIKELSKSLEVFLDL